MKLIDLVKRMLPNHCRRCGKSYVVLSTSAFGLPAERSENGSWWRIGDAAKVDDSLRGCPDGHEGYRDREIIGDGLPPFVTGRPGRFAGRTYYYGICVECAGGESA